MTVTGKHKEILIELLIHYFSTTVFIGYDIARQKMVNDIKEQNKAGKVLIEYYINNAYVYKLLYKQLW